jgi:hypothetical protein
VGDVCGTSWLSWLDRPGVAPGQQVAMTALVPLAVVGLLWWLAGATWDRYERVKPPASDTAARPVVVRTPLEDRAMWNGRGPVRRLRAVHIATGLALPGVFALAPVRSGGVPSRLVLVALLVFLLAVVVAVAHPGIARRERPTVALARTRSPQSGGALSASCRGARPCSPPSPSSWWRRRRPRHP